MSLVMFALAAMLNGFTVDSAGNEFSSVSVAVHGIQDARGTIRIALFDSDEAWLKKPVMDASIPAVNAECEWRAESLPQGSYAIAVFHDINDNGHNDRNRLGIPREPWAVSNDVRRRFGPPRWKSARFEVSSDTTIVVKIR